MAESRRDAQGLGREVQLHAASHRSRKPPGPLDLQAESPAGVGSDPQPAQPAIQSPARRAEPKAQSAEEARSAILPARGVNQEAFGQFPNTLQGFEDAALDWLVGAELNPD